MSDSSRRISAAALALALLVTAGAATVTAPGDEEVFGAIDVAGVPGEPVQSRALDVTVTEVRLGQTLDLNDDFLTTDTTTVGVWVVADVTATWNVRGGSFSFATLRVGDRDYRASDIAPVSSSLLFAQTQAGVPITGSLVFEVPRSVLAQPGSDRAELRFETATETGPDTVPAVRVDLASLEVQPVAEVRLRIEEGLE